MPKLLDLPLELRNYVYDFLLQEPLERRFRGVLLVGEKYVKEHLPLRCYRGLLRSCRQIYREFKEAIRHLHSSQQLVYEFDITFSHGRPYFSLTWLRFSALSPIVNAITVNVDLHLREPFSETGIAFTVPHDHELVHLLDDEPGNFAEQLGAYISILLKTLASLVAQGDPTSNLLYTETLTLNLRRPTQMVLSSIDTRTRRVIVNKEEATRLDDMMRSTLKARTKAFKAFDAKDCNKLSPHIQIGSLRFATEGVLWGEGHNLVMANDQFQWLKY